MKKLVNRLIGSKTNRGSLIIVGLYMLLGGLWILFSDRIVSQLVSDHETLTIVNTAKGWGYVLVTGILLYIMILGNNRILRRANRNYLLLAENISDVIFVIDMTTAKFVFVSPSIQPLLGLSPNEVLSQPIENILPHYTHDYTQLLQSRAAEFHQEQVKHYTDELVVNRKNGAPVWIELNSRVLVNPENQHAELYATARDISERKQAEEQIQLQLKRVSALNEIGRAIAGSLDLHQTLDVLLSELRSQLNVDAASVFLLKSGTELLEYATGSGFRSVAISTFDLRMGDGFAGQAAQQREVIHVPDLPRVQGQFRRAALLKNEEFVEYFGIPLIAKGELKGVLEIFNRSHLTTGPDWMRYMETLGGQAAIAIDNALLLTGLQQANASLEERVTERTLELSRVNAELSRANHAKDEFLANMSHELRTPLTAILSTAESMLENVAGPLNARQVQYISTIEASGHHLLALINDILDLSKIEAGKLEPHFELSWIHEICQSSLAFVRETAHKKKIRLAFHCEPQAFQAIVDPRRLKQMIVNLLDNAVKFTQTDGQVDLKVTAEPQDSLIQIAVIDTGIGISSEDLRRLFTPFTQVDSSLSRQQEGSGLGLALVQKLVELHGGGVAVESEVGQGSRFILTIPWRQSLQAPVPVKSEPTPALAFAPGGPGRRVLLAEDNPVNAQTTQEYLTATGYEVAVAQNGGEVIPLATAFQPDLLLIDIQMPVMDGMEVMRRLRQIPAFTSTPIIALTALAMPGDRARCLDAGANEYLSKPFRLKSLVEMIKTLLPSDHGEK